MAAELRTGAAGLGVAVAVPAVVTATGERPHIMQDPHDRLVPFCQCFNAHEAVANPVQQNDVGLQARHCRGE